MLYWIYKTLAKLRNLFFAQMKSFLKRMDFSTSLTGDGIYKRTLNKNIGYKRKGIKGPMTLHQLQQSRQRIKRHNGETRAFDSTRLKHSAGYPKE